MDTIAAEAISQGDEEAAYSILAESPRLPTNIAHTIDHARKSPSDRRGS
jgi:hypothetical protein